MTQATLNGVVFGASGGLGSAVQRALVETKRCAYLYMVDVDNKAFFQVDVSDPEEVQTFFNLHFQNKPVDFIVNCAGVNAPTAIADLDYDKLMYHIDVNLGGFVHILRAAEPHMVVKGGVVCNVVSTAATWAMTNSLAYCASKAAALQATRVAAREMRRKYGMTVFSVSPHVLAGTPMTKQVYENLPKPLSEGAKASLENAIPPDSVAELIAFLVTERSRYYHLNGCDIPYGDPRQ